MTKKEAQEMSTEQLEQMLADRKATEKKAKEKAKHDYEVSRDKMIHDVIGNAREINYKLIEFKRELHENMENQVEKLQEYGGIRSNSKGGFSITTTDGLMRVTRTRATEPVWDERSTKAVELIKSFLYDTVKKNNRKLFEILLSFIEKNKNGDLEYGKVMSLIQHEDKYKDERWLKGLELIKESYQVHLRGYGYEFRIKNENGNWERIDVNFTSVE